MRDLSAKLATLSAHRPQAPAKPLPQGCYVRETRVPLGDMGGLSGLSLEALREVDPALGLEELNLERLLFMDTETTGLSGGAGTVAFLLGMGWLEGDHFVIRQLLMRDYPEEIFLLTGYGDRLKQSDAIVTYNGKTFDLPLLGTRMTLARMRGENRALPHLDLLHPTRRVYRMRLDCCTLSHIERTVLGIHRQGDIPGSEVPERFFSYLRTGEFALLEDVLSHNAQDILSMAHLLSKLAQAYRQPEQLAFAQDILSVGRVLEKRGQRQAARNCFSAASGGSFAGEARLCMAGSLKRDAHWEDAEKVYMDMVVRGEGGFTPYIELAKLLEHRKRDYARALAYTQAALNRPGSDAILRGDMERRLQRLQRRLAKKES